MLLVDAANVIGSRPTGWWRDRAGAAAGFVHRLRESDPAVVPRPVVVVLEGQARRGVGEGEADGVTVLHAPGEGDDTMAAIAERTDDDVLLVSADRGLAQRVRDAGGEVVGPSWLLDRLEAD